MKKILLFVSLIVGCYCVVQATPGTLGGPTLGPSPSTGTNGGGGGGGGNVTTNQLYIYTGTNAVIGRPMVRGTSTNDFTSSEIIYSTTNVAPYIQSAQSIVNTNTVYTLGNFRATLQGDLVAIATVGVGYSGFVAWTNNGVGHLIPFSKVAGVASTDPIMISGIELSPNATFQFIVTSGLVIGTNAFYNIN